MAGGMDARDAGAGGLPNPFGDFAPSVDFYPSASHRKVVHRITRSLESRCGMLLLTGEIGIGKTSVSLYVQEHFSEGFSFVPLPNPFLTPAERVRAVLDQLDAGGETERTMDGLVARASMLYRQGRPAVLVLDECHLLQRESFSQLQVLSNLREGGSPLVQMLLVGQVEIADRLREPGMEAFNQRIGVRCELEPLNLHDTRRYVEFKLERGGYPAPEIFEPSAVERIWRISGGLPRLVNHACSYALDQVAFCGLTRVTPRIVDDVVRDSMYKDLYGVRTKGGGSLASRAVLAAALAACGAGALGVVGWAAGWWAPPAGSRPPVVAQAPALQAPAPARSVVVQARVPEVAGSAAPASPSLVEDLAAQALEPPMAVSGQGTDRAAWRPQETVSPAPADDGASVIRDVAGLEPPYARPAAPSAPAEGRDDVASGPEAAASGEVVAEADSVASALRVEVPEARDEGAQAAESVRADAPETAFASASAPAPDAPRVLDGAEHPVVGKVSVDAVAWADEAAARIAVLDGRVLREGGTLPGGLTLLRIGDNDLFLEYQGTIYSLRWNEPQGDTK